jgi:alpha-beta hydrolase superfamily lysophospholipase
MSRILLLKFWILPWVGSWKVFEQVRQWAEFTGRQISMFTIRRYFLTGIIGLVLFNAGIFPALYAGEKKGKWSSFDGADFPYTSWLDYGQAKPKAIVVCVHGLSGAASDFEQLGTRLSKQGMAVYAHELRGQGNDPKASRIGDLRSPNLWFKDLESFLAMTRGRHREAPVFLYGESLGALIVMHGFSGLSAANRSAVRGMIYASPVVALPETLPPVREFLVRVVMRVLPKLKVSLVNLAGKQSDKVTGDSGHWEQMQKTKHYVPRFTLRFLMAVEKMAWGGTGAARPVRKPVLVVYPGQDVFTKPAQVEQFFKALESPDKTKRLFAESHHLLAFDKEREALFKLVGEWIGKRSGQANAPEPVPGR